MICKRFEKSKSDITDYRIYDYEKEDAYFINCDDESTVDAIVDLLNTQQTIIEQLRTQLAICQQSKNDDGRFRVWEVPPITIGTRITTSTTFNGDKDEI